MDLLIFPNQLFQSHPGFRLNPDRVVLIEDSLFFGDDRYPLQFHQQKLWLHRVTMKRYEAFLQQQGYATCYLEYDPQPHSLANHLESLLKSEPSDDSRWFVVEPSDFILEKRLANISRLLGVELGYLENPGFLNTPGQNREYRDSRSRWFMGDFYKWQRRRLNLLMDGDQPLGGQWSYDHDNRKKIPRALLGEIPVLPQPRTCPEGEAAKQYVYKRFADNPGSLDRLYYPTSHTSAKHWLKVFLAKRLGHFGDYEDAILKDESWLWHSVLTPSLNIGLLTPQDIIRATMRHAERHEVALNSLEGFLRQVIGWREFMRATYQDLGVQMRTANHWQHHGQMPAAFYDASSGILPVDNAIERVLQTGYCHHIERLMVLGGFFFLCEICPTAIYRWFMELFVDSYDWVMVPNVYAMSQDAAGGLITTKPYFSGSSYIRRMSHYSAGPWCETWDGLYWRWIQKNSTVLGRNPRWAMMCRQVEKMGHDKLQTHVANAENFLTTLRPT
ncbi:MAG: cryptochrome/photolyase family protein [Planctomycetota bacterium]|nr:cryptochrome/photolyase family protein [Planctomycetota bacterium]